MAAQGLTIAGLVVLLGIGGALLLASMISSSLHRLKSGADQLQDFDFQTPIDVPSSITEISSLSQAMNRARDAIFTFALFVPRELVRKGMKSGSFSSRTAARQQVTAIFTDIYDFTTISERYPPEEVVTMLSVYFDVLNQAVSAHKGTIIQFLGDSIFAMWNAPGSDDDHAENACLSALAMQAALAEFNDGQRLKNLPEFRTRFGIHTGAAVVGNVGAADRLQYTAMGDTINVASRLEGMNKNYGTTILASAEVKARCSDRILFRPIGLGHAKGRHTGIELFEVVRGLSQTSSEAATIP
jgi:adenylate cyclase